MVESFILIIKYLFLGLLQGIIEPIPISSSGHLVIVQELFGIETQGEGLGFEVFVHFASLIAVLIVFREDIVRIVRNTIRYIVHREEESKSEFWFAMFVIIGTIPAGIIGVLFDDVIEGTLSSVKTVGITLIITGIALWLIRKLEGYKGEKKMTTRDALIVGLAQAVALIPGISRSGATIVGSMALGLDRDTALRFSFLLYIPVSLGGMILKTDDIITDPMIGTLAIPYMVAFIASLVASYFALRWFIDIMRKGKLGYFSLYCWIVGPLVILFL